MSKRAEEASLKAYPPKKFLPFMAQNYQDKNKAKRVVYRQGYEQAEKDLGWHSVKDSLPPMGEEVIVLTDFTNGKYIRGSHRICYGHIVDKTIAFDYDGWNLPGVTHWMYLPKLED